MRKMKVEGCRVGDKVEMRGERESWPGAGGIVALDWVG